MLFNKMSHARTARCFICKEKKDLLGGRRSLSIVTSCLHEKFLSQTPFYCVLHLSEYCIIKNTSFLIIAW